jgi:fatty acyl-ACP thioesterase A
MLKVSCNVGMDQIAIAQCGFLGRPMPVPLPAFTLRRYPAVSGRPLGKAPVLAVISDRGCLGRAIVSGSGCLADRLRLGSLTEDGLSYKERFVVRSYEVGINKTATVETIANLLQVLN